MSKIKIFALGGLNEVGKNMYVVDVDNDLFILDAGSKYADDRMLGIDYIIPNYDFLKENVNRIQGIFISHAHDEQMGAVTDIIKELPEIKVYGTSFTLNKIRNEFIEENVDQKNLIEIKPYQKLEFKDVSVFPIRLTHSVPDSLGYVVNTKDGAIVYTSNFAFDPTMVGPYKTDIGKLGFIGKQGVLCLLAESLYSSKKGYTSPNHRTNEVFRDIFNKNYKRILINVFNSQIYRIQEILTELEKTNRQVVIMGKSLESEIIKAIDDKYIKFDKSRIGNIHNVNDDNVVIIISDEREKQFSNIKRIIKGYDKFIKATTDDTIIIASNIYEGMEKTATDVFDNIAKIGINLIILPTDKYLSLHASSEDLMLMIDLINPKYYIPVIGEYRHQVENANLARILGINDSNILIRLNGEVITFNNGILAADNEKVKVDDILVDGKISNDIGELVLKDREALSENGVVLITTTIDKESKNILAGPEILTRGFIYVNENKEIIDNVAKIALDVIKKNTKNKYCDYNRIRLDIRDQVGKYLYKETECNPMILLVLQEV